MLAVAAALFFLTACQSSPDPASQQLDWRIVAESQVILIGEMEVPQLAIRRNTLTGHHNYVSIPVRVDRFIKGKTDQPITIQYYTKPQGSSPVPHNVCRLNKRKVIIFLVTASGDYYFAGYTPVALQPFDPKLEGRLKDELAQQEALLKNFKSLFPAHREPLLAKVKNLIESTTHRSSQERAFRSLEALGTAGVPAMIMLMDDRRALPIKHISLQNHGPGAWEAERHYGPETVVDAISAILNQITGESFGDIMNGASDADRVRIINGWRVYLCHLKGKAGS